MGSEGSAKLPDGLSGNQRERSQPFAMLLDDEPDTAEMYRLGLEAGGFRVAVATEAAELFEAIEHEVPDILVLDYRLRGMTAVDVLDVLRKDTRTAKVPVFILSNYLGDQDGAIDRVFAAGVLAWLKKPATPPKALARKLLQAVSRPRRPKD